LKAGGGAVARDEVPVPILHLALSDRPFAGPISVEWLKVEIDPFAAWLWEFPATGRAAKDTRFTSEPSSAARARQQGMQRVPVTRQRETHWLCMLMAWSST
jgi:hypothetical protein